MTKTNTRMTYEWLQTAFGEKPSLSKKEMIKKAEDIKRLVDEEIQEFIDAVKEGDTSEMLNACCDAMVVINNLPYFAGFSVEDIEQEDEKVFNSNMTKFCKTEEEAKETVQLYREGNHPNKKGHKIDTYYKETGDPKYKFVILDTRTNKVLKSKNFVDVKHIPDIEYIVATANAEIHTSDNHISTDKNLFLEIINKHKQEAPNQEVIQRKEIVQTSNKVVVFSNGLWCREEEFDYFSSLPRKVTDFGYIYGFSSPMINQRGLVSEQLRDGYTLWVK